MNARVYDISMLAGVALCSVGAYFVAGVGPALITGGVLIILITAFSTYVVAWR